MKEKFSRLMKWGWRSPFTASAILFVLGLSPVGFAIPYFILSEIDICRGALGSGVHCALPTPVAGYLEVLAMYLEVSCFIFALCVPWLLAAVAVWVGFVVYLARAIYRVFRPA